ncbi:MAG: hypothetical protein R3F49_20165 [Planctomycetota bacterium]
MELRTLILSVLSLAALSGCTSSASPDAPAAPSPAPAAASNQGAAAASGVIPEELPRFIGQDGWIAEAVVKPMRLQQFRLAGDAGAGDVELVIASWPNGIGPRSANLDRWATQMGLPSVEPEQVTEQDVRHFRVATVHLEGAYTPVDGPTQPKGMGLLASMVEVPGEARCWTIKATGPAATVTRWKDSYLRFIAGL